MMNHTYYPKVLLTHQIRGFKSNTYATTKNYYVPFVNSFIQTLICQVIKDEKLQKKLLLKKNEIATESNELLFWHHA